MPIRQPGRVLLRNVPLAFVAQRAGGHASKAVNVDIPLVPFIDLQICLVVFLLMSFNASGELVTQKPNLQLPRAEHTQQLKLAPILSIDPVAVTLDGRRMADTATLAADAKVERIEPLIADLETLHRNWNVLHPQQDFPGEIVIQSDKSIDYRVIKKLMFSAGLAGYPKISFAVTQVGDAP